MKKPHLRHHWQLFTVLGAGLLTAVVTAGLAAFVPTTAPTARETTGHGEWHAVAGAPSAGAADKAVELQAMMGQHAVLAAGVMRSRIRGDDDFVQAANSALGKNTDAMTRMVSSLFGDAAGKGFAPLWSGHIVQLVAYAGALGNQDGEALRTAKDELVRAENELAAFFSGASQGRLPGDAARSAVAMHVEHLTGQADAYAAKDYAAADRLYRENFQHTYDLGGVLAGALLPPADAAVLQEPIWRLRSQLGKLLAEHAVVVQDVSRAAITDTPDFASAGTTINLNTEAIGQAIGTLFGADAGRQFQDQWSAHVEQLVAYGAAAGKNDAAAKEAAVAKLREFERAMATFLAGAVAGKISEADLSAALTAHDDMLIKHADEYAAKNYTAAHETAYETYNHMFALARTLADAFGEDVAKRLPTGGAQTGYGGLADAVGGR